MATEEDWTPRVGARIRRMREQAGIGLREQARLLNISPSSLSQLETGKGSTSIARLQEIASHLGVTVADLLADEGHASVMSEDQTLEIFRPSDYGSNAVSRGKGVRYMLLGSGKGHAQQPYMITFEPGAGYERDQIGHPGEECTLVLMGAIILIFGTEEYRLNQGDLARFPSDVYHSFRNALPDMTSVIFGAATPPW